MKGKCIIFSAPSGAGKTTIVQYLLNKPELKLEFSVSATSRKPRAGEKNGQDYYFLSIDQFRQKIMNNEFIEWEEVYENNFYGTLKSEVERIWEKGNHVVFDVDVAGGLNLKKQLGDQALLIFVMPPSVEELERRLKSRSTDDDETIAKRIAKANFELSFAPKFDVRIVNDILAEALQKSSQTVSAFLKNE